MTKTFFVTMGTPDRSEVIEAIFSFTEEKFFMLCTGAVKDGEVVRVIDSNDKSAIITNYRTGDIRRVVLEEPIEFEVAMSDKVASLLTSLETGDIKAINKEGFDSSHEFISVEASDV